ncbi:MltR family transcriptional regulator [Mannheimia granulomatis]|uniref:Mannitol repressor protein n=1 Tax=Mannheimia granulomatis TaxID=85402 RepID=A0A011N9X6_9PAST|nr:MltR family transcriptional regulator [Mannheimia granulomatis]EXI61240.1 mannitol repressor protein [Mannheimia granulomatis]QLB18011.1 transcriptional regulator [Mannheimia granulomatis]
MVDYIDKLNEEPTLRGFLTLANQLFSSQVEQLIERVFRKTDFALKSVVDSLFEHQGPLAELSVRLKVLLGLGVISPKVFEDISLFLEVKQHLYEEEEEFSFSHPAVVQFVKDLHHIDFFPINELLKGKSSQGNKDSMLFQMQQMRLEKMIRSSLILAITEIDEQLNVESPL